MLKLLYISFKFKNFNKMVNYNKNYKKMLNNKIEEFLKYLKKELEKMKITKSNKKILFILISLSIIFVVIISFGIIKR